MCMPSVINVIVAGLGGQGVIKASDILAEAAFLAGFDVKKTEVHGMSQRGGSVSTDVRLGAKVLSPMVPPGEADYLVVVATDQIPVHQHRLRDNGKGVLIEPGMIDVSQLHSARSLNVALLGALAAHLPIDRGPWMTAISNLLDVKFLPANQQAFELGWSIAKP